MFYTIYSVHYLSLQLYIGELFLFYNFTLVTYITLHLLWMSEHNLCSSALAAKLTLFFEIIVFYLKKRDHPTFGEMDFSQRQIVMKNNISVKLFI